MLHTVAQVRSVLHLLSEAIPPRPDRHDHLWSRNVSNDNSFRSPRTSGGCGHISGGAGFQLYSPIDAAIDAFLNSNAWAMDILRFVLAGLP
jgi:hypothetical protein